MAELCKACGQPLRDAAILGASVCTDLRCALVGVPIVYTPTERSTMADDKRAEFEKLAVSRGCHIERDKTYRLDGYADRDTDNLWAGWQAALAQSEAWKETIIEACVVNCIPWDENDAAKTLSDLIAWENKIALDPAVSKEAHDLVERGAAQAEARIKALKAERDAVRKYAVHDLDCPCYAKPIYRTAVEKKHSWYLNKRCTCGLTPLLESGESQ